MSQKFPDWTFENFSYYYAMVKMAKVNCVTYVTFDVTYVTHLF